jgi:hypothetical protein
MPPPAASQGSPWDGAAGGRSTNASQLFGHNRAHLNGGGIQAQGFAGGRTNNASQQLFGHHRGGHQSSAPPNPPPSYGHAPPPGQPAYYAQPPQQQSPSPQWRQQMLASPPSATPDPFLGALEQAEWRDEQEQLELRALEEEQLALQRAAAADEQMVAAAAAQIAAEQGLGPAEQAALENQLRAKLRAQAAHGVVPSSQVAALYGDDDEEEEEEGYYDDDGGGGGAEYGEEDRGGYQYNPFQPSAPAAAGGFHHGAPAQFAAGGYRGVGGAAHRDPNASSVVGGIFA